VQGQLGVEEVDEGQKEAAFRLRAPPVLSSEQLRSPLAISGDSPAASVFPNDSAKNVADHSNDDFEEEVLPRRRPRRESVAVTAAARAVVTAPSLVSPQELVDWCIAQAVSVTKLPFEQAPSSVADQIAAFSAAFHEQVFISFLVFCVLFCSFKFH
jgi:hypothetical protein